MSSGADLSILSGDDLTLLGADIDVGGNANLAATGDILVGTVQDSYETLDIDQRSSGTFSSAKRYTWTTEGTVNVATTLDVGGNLNINTITNEDGSIAAVNSGNVAIEGSLIEAGGDITAYAGGDLSVTSTEEYQEETFDKKRDGLVSNSRRSDSYELTTQSGGSVAAAGDVTLIAQENLSVEAGIVASSEGDVTLSAQDGSVLVTGRDETFSEAHHRSQSGLIASSSGGSLQVGYGSSSSDDTSTQTNTVGSYIIAEQGSVAINAGQDIDVIGSTVSAGQDIGLTAAGDVNILAGENSGQSTSESQSTFVGFTASVYENVSGAVDSVSSLPDRAGQGEGGIAQTAVTGASEALRSYGDVTSALTNTAGANVSFGFSSEESSSSNAYTQSVGSTLAAGNDIAITADHINVEGANILADNNIALTALQDINITAGTNTSEEESSGSSTGFSVGVGVSVGINGITPTASANANYSQSEGQSTSTTYTNSSVNAGGTLTTDAGRDLTIEGANIHGTDVDITVGRDLTVASLQDTATSSQDSFGVNVGTSITGEFGIDPNSNGPGGLIVRSVDGSNSYSGGVNIGDANSESAVVTNQTTLTGESIEINVTEHTQVDGAVIAAVDTEGNDNSDLTLSTGTLGVTNINDTASSHDTTIGISGSVNDPFRAQAEDGAGTGITHDTSNDGRGVTDHLQDLPSLDASHTESIFEQDTFGTIGQGEIEIREGDGTELDDVNRDVTNSQIVLRDETSEFTINVDPSTIVDFYENFDGVEGNSTLEQLEISIRNGFEELRNDVAIFQIAAIIEGATSQEDRDRIIKLVNILEYVGVDSIDILTTVENLSDNFLAKNQDTQNIIHLTESISEENWAALSKLLDEFGNDNNTILFLTGYAPLERNEAKLAQYEERLEKSRISYSNLTLAYNAAVEKYGSNSEQAKQLQEKRTKLKKHIHYLEYQIPQLKAKIGAQRKLLNEPEKVIGGGARTGQCYGTAVACATTRAPLACAGTAGCIAQGAYGDQRDKDREYYEETERENNEDNENNDTENE